MVDNRYATALVIGSVLSLLAAVYLSVAVGTQNWYQYSSPAGVHESTNATALRDDLINGEFNEKTSSETLYLLNGTLGLWWRCILVPSPSHWFKEPDLWRCQFLLPLVSLALVFLSSLVGVCACLCRSFKPTVVVGVMHLLAALCSLGCVCCFRAGVDLLHKYAVPPKEVESSMGWSLYLALISFPLQMMAAALFLWAACSHRKNYTRMVAYRVA
ncbi:claudin domain-containing protein 1-like isoform X2 [Dunckerocampus dactyliophorus]|uniref:claudin domain-containing protein 1-like isoform X2 n=1 Tax=Dunckerocampus dactyliophorus TaxID=161453 RepID=UPI0024069B2B|nr:claudin domain-containing protein 1-like isoform X2 [Dunckerocampus dactyliophorus]